MKAFDGHPLDQIFTHVDPEGLTRHYNASAILRAIMRKQITPVPELTEVNLDAELVKHVEENQGVEQDHVDRLTEKDTNIPILMVHLDDGFDLIIDGNHRLVKRWRMGKTTISVIVLSEDQARPYLIEDMDELFPLEVAIPFLDKVSARLKK